MRLRYALPFLALCWPSLAMAQQSVAFSNLIPIPNSFCQLSAMSAIGLGSCNTGGGAATAVVIVIETADVRWRDDGVAPTSSAGMLTAFGSTLTYQGDLTKIQFIAVSGSPTLDISFYKTR